MDSIKEWYIKQLEGNILVDEIGEVEWECVSATEWRGNVGDPAQFLFRRIPIDIEGLCTPALGQVDLIKLRVEEGRFIIKPNLRELIEKWKV